ncbi:DUF4272 domain-containing protein [Celeribacter persicus]|jgi:hypothetical protein|uniref:Uncharacterized protein DUF4272 n=1 Tax=Celeribacter persicus TaxID=1651082 RepID=A0A2T5HVT9_9RHOB|nr:DUF4272 domain-containing protein [Celeribacter persicus]PTQ75707.1 uncharacterized protein DUF4272 [Celeribacter persicus]
MKLFERVFGSKKDAAELRKDRVIARLIDEAVPSNDFLPPHIAVGEDIRRSEEEIVTRLLGAMISAVKGETRDDELIAKVIAQYGAEDCFTPEERAFIDTPEPSDEACVKFAWRYEGVYVLMWALGFFDTLPYPTDIVHVPDMGKLMSRLGREGLLAEARLRPQDDILNAAELAYRYNWAATNARMNNRPAPSNLDAGVVYERHYAFNWLVGYGKQSWDTISTDT